MEPDRLNRWLTFGANVGVLIGIILILIELNQNSEMMRAQMTQARVDNLVGSYESRMHSDHWAEIMAKGRAAPTQADWLESLTPVEYERVRFMLFRDGNDIQGQYLLYRDGFLDELVWNTGTRGQIIRHTYLRAAFGRACYSNTEFQDVLNNIAAEEDAPQCHGDGVWE